LNKARDGLELLVIADTELVRGIELVAIAGGGDIRKAPSVAWLPTYSYYKKSRMPGKFSSKHRERGESTSLFSE
jgi:hypothetical protein